MATAPAVLWKWADATARALQSVRQLEIGSYGLQLDTGRLYQAIGAGVGATLWAQVAISTDDPEDLAARIAVLETEFAAQAYYSGSCVAAVEYDGASWEAASARLTFVDGAASNITRANATFTFAKAGKYLWVITGSFTGDGAALLGLRIRSTTPATLATAFGNTIGSTTNGFHLNTIIAAAAAAQQSLQVASSGTVNELPQITIDSQIMANFNISIARIGA